MRNILVCMLWGKELVNCWENKDFIDNNEKGKNNEY